MGKKGPISPKCGQIASGLVSLIGRGLSLLAL
jgi:hypothetical protein